MDHATPPDDATPPPDFPAQINHAFTDFCAQQAALMVSNHDTVRGAVIVGIDGNGYISIASFALSPTGVNLLLADALHLNQTRQPDVEARLVAGQPLNELATATAEHAAALAGGDAPVAALEADAAEGSDDAEGARTADATPTQH